MNTAETTSAREARHNAVMTLAFGITLIVGSIVIWYFSRDIRAFGLARNDPGPRAVPLTCAALLFAGGVGQAFFAARQLMQQRPMADPASASSSASMSVHAGLYVAFTVLLLGGYLLALTWLGFIVSTPLFAFLFLKFLGSGWLEASVTALLLVILISVLFVSVFRVPLPAGELQLFSF